METYRLPNGDYTASVQEYGETWDKLFSTLEKYYNLEVIACSETRVQVKQKDSWNNCVTLPMWLVNEMIKETV